MRTIHSVNGGWKYSADFQPGYEAVDYPTDAWESVCLPHTNLEMPYNGFDEKQYQFVSTYARDISTAAGAKRMFLDFDGVMCSCEVWVNGAKAGSHDGGFTPFSIELTGLAAPGGTARVVVRVDSTERKDIPPFGHVVDYLCFGGIYRDVYLRTQGSRFVKSVFTVPGDVLAKEKSLSVEVELDAGDAAAEASAKNPLPLRVRCELLDGDRIVGASQESLGPQAPLVPPAAKDRPDGKVRLELDSLAGLRVWEISDPALYNLRVRLFEGDEAVDETTVRIGFRLAEFRSDGFFLNGNRINLVGLNRHQAWPHSGYAMPRRAQRRDADTLKNELGINLVRTSHYPQSPHFLDACDEIGLLVFEEIPGWQHIGDQAWQDNSCRDLEAMIRRDRNRPSVILWGVRINESPDSDDFYARTNAIARALDPTRQTGGVRCIENSKLLEDVYTFNDFSHSGGGLILKKPRRVTKLKRDVPYLVTEHNGHMFPAKRFDNEERLAEHALRHAKVLDAAAGTPGICGAIGWCAFDYNTHKDFGSGDRICYHGVSDMFRMPKYAAFAYSSQRNPAERIVLEAASGFAKGERSAARLLPIDVYTNCDSVILYRGGRRVGQYFPDRKRFPNLAHPPVVIRDLIGDQLAGSKFKERDQVLLRQVVSTIFSTGFESLKWHELVRLGLLLARYRMSREEASALISEYTLAWGREDETFELAGMIGGEEKLRRTYGANAHACDVSIEAEDRALKGGDWDTTRVSVRVLDQYGSIHPFIAEAVQVAVDGPGNLIGPSLLPLIGGCVAFWVRTTGEKGVIGVRVESERFGVRSLDIDVEA